MRTVLALLIGLALPAGGISAPPETFHYLGEVKLSSATGQALGSQVILVEKTHDRDKAEVVERAVVVQANGKVDEYTSRLKVKDDNTFTLRDEANGIEGSGQLFGPAWKWTYFKGTFKAPRGVQIEDENFLADESVNSARKKVIGPDGKVIVYMDMSLKSTSPKTFEILRNTLLKK